MALPTYDKSQRRSSFQKLPKGAYVVRFIGAKEDKWASGGAVLRLRFDIAEGEFKDYFGKLYEQRKAQNEDAVWPYDGVFSLNIPATGSDEYVWRNWNTFFADLEDSNNGFVFDGDIQKIKGKIIGAKFRIRQSENKNGGEPYENVEMRWTCVADDVRTGNIGRMPNDVLLSDKRNNKDKAGSGEHEESPDWMKVPEGDSEEVPW